MELNTQLIQATLNYLAARPYNEVRPLIEAWEVALKPKPNDLKPKEVKEKVAKKQ